ncbi:MAG: phospho-sugar mutase [Chlamydiae bacterium]|nr:phospho-sugar mutase [Chlamydiota bacterium]
MPTATERAHIWSHAPFDIATQEEVRRLIRDNPKELEDCFYTELVFGTGGLRGLMGVGPNRMNRYTVRKATQGLALYLQRCFPHQPLSVVIGFDSRLHSQEFAKEACETLLCHGIHVFFLRELRPTPLVSFACRYYRAHAAIMITASHNPKEYNGYKVYWQDGAQITSPHDQAILQEIQKLDDFSILPKLIRGTLHEVLEEVDTAYLQAIHPLQVALQPSLPADKPLRIIYTSLHGTGITLAPKALASWGFSCEPVKVQCIPDGEFPTVRVPNPEYKEALTMGLQQLQENSADLLLATDPDADRLAVAAMHEGVPYLLTGNEIASLCADYLCRTLHRTKTLSSKAAIVTTIVSTDLLEAICNAYHIHCVKVLTGFKYIGECIHLWEQNTTDPLSFLFGAEESYGYLYGTHARDKDGIISSCLLAQIAAEGKQQGKTLFTLLCELYQTYGIFAEETLSIDFPQGKEGITQMNTLLSSLRSSPPQKIHGIPVVERQDFLDVATTRLPSSNVLLFRLQDGSKIVIRPSGTEPKLKIYGGMRHPCILVTLNAILTAKQKTKELLQTVRKEWNC